MEDLIFIGKPLIEFIKKQVTKKYYTHITPGRSIQHNLQDIIEGILYICKTGTQIRFVNYKGIAGSALYYHFRKWTIGGVFSDCWNKVYDKYQKNCKHNKNLKHLSIDCTKIKSINGIDCIGRNSTDRGRNGTQLSVIVDLIGVPVGYYLDPANVHDTKMMHNTFKNKIYKRKSRSKLYGDKGYSIKNCVKIAEDYNCTLLCENKINAVNKLFPDNNKTVKDIRKHRYVVEASFSWMKGFRKIILRYDRYIDNFEAYILIAFSLVTCKKLI